MGGQVDGLDVADQRHRDRAGKVDVIVAGKIGDLEDADMERIERRDLVIVVQAPRRLGASGALKFCTP